MFWYRAWYGSWNEPGGVNRLPGTYDRKEIFTAAQETANRTGKPVTVEKVVPTGKGLAAEYTIVKPS